MPARKIVIIGGGIQGVSTAFYLSRHPKFKECQVTVVEATGIASAASGKAGGFIALDWASMTGTDSLARASYALHESLAEEYGGDEKWGYRKLDTVALSMSFKKRKRMSKIIPNNVPSDLNWVDTNTVTSLSSIGTTKTTAQVHPYKLTHFLYKEALNAGVQFLHGTVREIKFCLNQPCQVVSVIVEPSPGPSQTRSLRSITETTVLPASQAVLAAGPWSGRKYFPLLDLSITGRRAHSVLIKPATETSAHALFTSLDIYGAMNEPEVYPRTDEVYICGESDNVPLPSSSDKCNYDPQRTRKLIEQAAHISPSHLSTKNGAQVLSEQACYLPVWEDGPGPLIGEWSPRTHRGLFVLTGHSCWGILLSLGSGKGLAEILLDGSTKTANIKNLAPS